MQQTEKEFIVPMNKQRKTPSSNQSITKYLCLHIPCMEPKWIPGTETNTTPNKSAPSSQASLNTSAFNLDKLTQTPVCAEHTCYRRSAGQSVVSTSESTQRRNDKLTAQAAALLSASLLRDLCVRAHAQHYHHAHKQAGKVLGTQMTPSLPLMFHRLLFLFLF